MQLMRLGETNAEREIPSVKRARAHTRSKGSCLLGVIDTRNHKHLFFPTLTKLAGSFER